MNNTLRVWDPLIRLFHWSLVATFVIAYVTGEEESLTHIYSGYAVAGLIVFRVLWGFVGTRYARFSDFIYSPAAVWSYIKSLVNHPRHYAGHNPAAGWMIIIMLITLGAVTLSGFEVYAIEEGKGPLAGNTTEIQLISTAYADDEHEHSEQHESDEDEAAEEFWEEIHEASSNFMVLLIVLHIGGVLIGGRLHGENLVRAMITGKKAQRSDH